MGAVIEYGFDTKYRYGHYPFRVVRSRNVQAQKNIIEGNLRLKKCPGSLGLGVIILVFNDWILMSTHVTSYKSIKTCFIAQGVA
jgi:hypothetical protein